MQGWGEAGCAAWSAGLDGHDYCVISHSLQREKIQTQGLMTVWAACAGGLSAFLKDLGYSTCILKRWRNAARFLGSGTDLVQF
jgi:hypothetical protein